MHWGIIAFWLRFQTRVLNIFGPFILTRYVFGPVHSPIFSVYVSRSVSTTFHEGVQSHQRPSRWRWFANVVLYLHSIHHLFQPVGTIEFLSFHDSIRLASYKWCKTCHEQAGCQRAFRNHISGYTDASLFAQCASNVAPIMNLRFRPNFALSTTKFTTDWIMHCGPSRREVTFGKYYPRTLQPWLAPFLRLHLFIQPYLFVRFGFFRSRALNLKNLAVDRKHIVGGSSQFVTPPCGRPSMPLSTSLSVHLSWLWYLPSLVRGYVSCALQLCDPSST